MRTTKWYGTEAAEHIAFGEKTRIHDPRRRSGDDEQLQLLCVLASFDAHIALVPLWAPSHVSSFLRSMNQRSTRQGVRTSLVHSPIKLPILSSEPRNTCSASTRVKFGCTRFWNVSSCRWRISGVLRRRQFRIALLTQKCLKQYY